VNVQDLEGWLRVLQSELYRPLAAICLYTIILSSYVFILAIASALYGVSYWMFRTWFLVSDWIWKYSQKKMGLFLH